MKKYNLEIRRVFLILILFFSLTIIGTLLHECGHLISMLLFGFNPTFHYSSTSFGNDIGLTTINYFIVLISGPLVNMIIGTIGFWVLLRNRNKFKEPYKVLFISVSFFWSRQVVIFLLGILIPFLKGSPLAYKNLSDEERMSLLVNLPQQTFSIIFGLIGIIICIYSVFAVLPKSEWIKFIFGGIIGCLLGSYVWFYLLGPIIIP